MQFMVSWVEETQQTKEEMVFVDQRLNDAKFVKLAIVRTRVEVVFRANDYQHARELVTQAFPNRIIFDIRRVGDSLV